MRVLITGGGMIGCHTAAELLRAGDAVTLFDLAPNETYIRRVAGQAVEIVRGDVRELPSLMETIQAARPDVVVHTAGLIGSVAGRLPYRGFQVNIGGTLNVAEAVRLTGVRRLVHASTLGVHDLRQPQVAPLKEEFPTSGGARVYGASKVACEELLRAYAATYGFELAILRFAAVYGYGHYVGGSGVGSNFHAMVRGAMQDRRAPIGSGLAAVDEFVYVKDLAHGVALAARAERLAHDVYHLGSGVLHTPDEVVAALARVLPGTTGMRTAEARPDPFPRRQPMDLSRARGDLGYEPRYDMEAGLRDLVAELERAAEA